MCTHQAPSESLSAIFALALRPSRVPLGHCANSTGTILSSLAALSPLLAIVASSHKLQVSEVPWTVRAIARCGAGTNNVPVNEMTAAGIPVFNTPGANANAVKELVIAGLLLGSRDIIGGACVNAPPKSPPDHFCSQFQTSKETHAHRNLLFLYICLWAVRGCSNVHVLLFQA